MDHEAIEPLQRAFQSLFAAHTLLTSAYLYPELQPETADPARTLATARQRAAAYLALLEALAPPEG